MNCTFECKNVINNEKFAKKKDTNKIHPIKEKLMRSDVHIENNEQSKCNQY